MKIVINTRFGGFSLSEVGETELRKRNKTFANSQYSLWNIERTDPILVQMVEENSALYSGSGAKLQVVEIPDDVQWHIHDYDGQEHVAENHRTWFS